MLVITGSESFLGGKLISSLKSKNQKFIGIDISENSQEYDFVKMDIRSVELEKIIPKNSTIIHLAALSSDPICRENPHQAFDINVMGTLNLIKTAIKVNAQQLIFASTEWVYGDFEGTEEKTEDTPIDITKFVSEYALSKIVSEMNLKQQYKKGLDNITILRFGIIYGPRERNWSAFESIVHSVKHSDSVSIGSLKTGRRFIHIDDIISGIELSVGKKGFEIINLSGDKIITLKDIICAAEQYYKKSIKILEKDSNNISIRNPSNEKAKKNLEWTPKINLIEGLKSIDPFV